MKFVVLLLIVGLFGSCFNEGDCLVSATNYMHLQFKKEANHSLDSAVILDTIYISGTDTSLVFNSATSAVLIPLDIHNATTTFIFQRTNPLDSTLAYDTLQVGYATRSKVIAKDCGAFTYYQNLAILKTNLREAQIKIYSTSLLKDPTSSGISAYAVNYQIFY